MEKIRLLIVEDNKLDRQTYLDTIRNINHDLGPNFEIEAIIKNNKHEGLSAISTMKDDLIGAFIDLKLTIGQPVDVNEGNEIIGEIYQKLRIPIVVLTNTPGGFDGNFQKSIFLRVFSKTDADYTSIILSLVGIYKTGITKILGRKGLIEMMLDEIFWKNISNTLQEWIDVSNSEKPLLRYTLTHLQEHLEIADDGTAFDTVQPIENYIKPSIKDYFFTGDIVINTSDKSKRFVIINPACDLAPHGEAKKPKASHIILVEVQSFVDTPFGGLVKKVKKGLGSVDNESDILKAKDTITKYITNSGSPQYYYLPDTSVVDGGIINFQRLSTVKYSEMQKFEKSATITSSFVKDIIAKFSFYYSRQGSPDFDFDKLLNYHLK